ncbi:bifunctional enzyme CysN/CysC [Dongia mobilis]|uniref:Adenylyl-sulfate kinase n=1 Tax=Dongia mobilis TaxID=578943 RepID=A0A4R6WNZ4_9PROT|nr:adenylyl-sulfate kinase [Dongia mobilis]TDQ80811.1 bifunctional enzyme CysN/CysC [Dongia mobilis]
MTTLNFPHAANDSVPQQARFPFAIVGHVDHGKSTLIGRLLHDTGSLPEGKLAELQAASDKRGGTLEWSFLLDAFQAERDQGITIDTTQIFFQTASRPYVIIDAPGHKEFLKNAVSGVAQAQAALLVIDAAEGVREQSRRHALILQLLGLRQVAVIVNKIDLIDFDAARFQHVADEITAFLGELGLSPKAVVPVSARHGDNIAARSAQTPWYSGETVVELLDGFEAAKPATEQPLRLPVQDVFKFDHRRLVVGRIESGRLKVGDRLTFAPTGKSARIASIESWNAAPQIAAVAGQSVAITLDDELFIERGHVAAHPERAPRLTHEATLRLFWLDAASLEPGDRIGLKIGTSDYGVSVEGIRAVIDVESLGRQVADRVPQNGIAEVTVRSRQPMAIDQVDEITRTGRAVLTRHGDIVGGAVILSRSAQAASDAIATEPRHLFSPDHHVTRAARAAANGHQGAVIWLTGLSGSGKSTLAMALERELFARGRQVYVLDGDTLRTGLNSDLGFGAEARAENIRRAAEMARLFADAGLVVITSLISPFAAERAKARAIVGANFHEVHVKADLATCEARDPKGLYAKARAGEIRNFTGIDSPYEAPENPDLAVDTALRSKDAALAELVSYVEKAISARTADLRQVVGKQ